MDVSYVCRNMRDADRRELFACRFDEDPDRLTMDVLQRWTIAWVVGLERPIAVLGGVEMWPGLWSVGMFATDEFGQIGSQLTRWLRRRMIPVAREAGARRLEARSIEGHDEAHRWLLKLGAERDEKPLTNWGKGGETFFNFVWEI